jgi:hypothetical protein
MPRNYADFLCRTFLFVAVALLPFLVWYLFDVILMAFGAIILAMLVWLVAEPFMRWLSLREASRWRSPEPSSSSSWLA